MKLELNKETLVALTEVEMSNTMGGGQARSNRRNTDCNYSRDHSHTTTYEDNGKCYEVTRCVAEGHPSYAMNPGDGMGDGPGTIGDMDAVHGETV